MYLYKYQSFNGMRNGLIIDILDFIKKLVFKRQFFG